MNQPYPQEINHAADAHGITPALAFGLGEGLNLYYSRRFGETPPHQITVVPAAFERKLVERLAMPRDEAIATALVGNGYGVMICTGDWHGLDGIEKWAEELSLWPMTEGWQSSVQAAVRLIEESDGLYRRSYGAFLDEAMHHFEGLEGARAMLDEIADDWLGIATRLQSEQGLERTGSRLLRLASRESRFWATILDQFGKGI